jgi:uncharacterized protein
MVRARLGTHQGHGPRENRGTWTGAEWATRLKSETLYRVIAVLLVIIAAVLLFAHDTEAGAPALTGGATQGRSTGFVVGVAASLVDVMGGEFLIPTLVLPFGADIKLAGSLSLAVSLVHHAGGPHAL